MQFPSFSMHADQNAMSFLAMCSIRRLLNRVHSTLYATGQHARVAETPCTSASIVAETNFETVCAELLRQLQTWYESLPDEIKPDLDSEIPRDLSDAWLRLRYWSVMHIIGRPFVIFVIMSIGKTDFAPHIMEYCKLCLDSCRNSIKMATHVLTQRTQYTWIIVHA